MTIVAHIVLYVGDLLALMVAISAVLRVRHLEAQRRQDREREARRALVTATAGALRGAYEVADDIERVARRAGVVVERGGRDD